MTDNELLTLILTEATRANELRELLLWGIYMLNGIIMLRIMTLRSTI